MWIQFCCCCYLVCVSWFLFIFEHILEGLLLLSVRSLQWEMFEHSYKAIMVVSDHRCPKQTSYVCSCLSGNVSCAWLSMSNISDSNYSQNDRQKLILIVIGFSEASSYNTVCVCVCACARVHSCMCVCACVPVHTHTCLCIYLHTYGCVNAHIYVYTYM